MNPLVTKTDLLTFAPEFAWLDAIAVTPHSSRLDIMLGVFNHASNIYVSESSFPNDTSESPYTPLYMAKLWIIAHWLKATTNTEGRVQSDKTADLQTTYATPDVNNEWNTTAYGQKFLDLRSLYCIGISWAP